MKAKSILIPLAAFALTVTTAQAFNSEVLVRAGLTDEQIEAFEEARELREEGDRDGARDVLVEAGVDEETLRKVHDAMHEYRDERRTAIDEAVENNDYEAFKEAITGSPLADIITSETDFEKFSEAHQLRQEGDNEAARDIMDELGFEPPRHGDGMMEGEERGEGFGKAHLFDSLTDEQRDALETAKEANDKNAMKAILEEAGIEAPNLGRHGGMHRPFMAEDK